jgi:hypothetical protein
MAAVSKTILSSGTKQSGLRNILLNSFAPPAATCGPQRNYAIKSSDIPTAK